MLLYFAHVGALPNSVADSDILMKIELGVRWLKLCKPFNFHHDKCVRFLAQTIPHATGFLWTPRERGDCGENGNTLAWQQLVASGEAFLGEKRAELAEHQIRMHPVMERRHAEYHTVI